nr:glycosyltransferase family 9 protein [uncultured Noviherbaspirillum sp.]
MSETGLALGRMRRIAVFRALQLGDLLCAVPALRALRKAAPRARITLIGLPWASSFVERFAHYVDDFIAFPGYPGMPESVPQPEAMPRFLEAARGRRFDLVLQLHGSGALSNPLVESLGAARTAGFYLAGEPCPDPSTFTAWWPHEHEVLRYLRLLWMLGAPPQGEHLEFPTSSSEHGELARAAPCLQAGGHVCIHPGARLPSRRWPPQRFAEVADALAGQGLTVVVTGSAEERPLAGAMLDAMQAAAIDLSGRTSLGALAVLLSNARLLVCNDTGVSHMAAAVGTPSVVVCSGADPARWAPLDRLRHRVLHADVPCRPCSYYACPIGHPCALGVGSRQVLAAASRLRDELMLH